MLKVLTLGSASCGCVIHTAWWDGGHPLTGDLGNVLLPPDLDTIRIAAKAAPTNQVFITEAQANALQQVYLQQQHPTAFATDPHPSPVVCPDHVGLGFTPVRYDVLHREWDRIGAVQAILSARSIDDGRINFSFTPTRVLRIGLSAAGISAQVRTAVQNACNTSVGPGLVQVV